MGADGRHAVISPYGSREALPEDVLIQAVRSGETPFLTGQPGVGAGHAAGFYWRIGLLQGGCLLDKGVLLLVFREAAMCGHPLQVGAQAMLCSASDSSSSHIAAPSPEIYVAGPPSSSSSAALESRQATMGSAASTP